MTFDKEMKSTAKDERSPILIRVILISAALLLLLAGLAPFGLLVLFHKWLALPEGGDEASYVILFMIAASVAGIVAIAVKSQAVFRWIAVSLFVLVALNLGGCAMIWNGLSKIH